MLHLTEFRSVCYSFHQNEIYQPVLLIFCKIYFEILDIFVVYLCRYHSLVFCAVLTDVHLCDIKRFVLVQQLQCSY